MDRISSNTRSDLPATARPPVSRSSSASRRSASSSARSARSSRSVAPGPQRLYQWDPQRRTRRPIDPVGHHAQGSSTNITRLQGPTARPRAPSVPGNIPSRPTLTEPQARPAAQGRSRQHRGRRPIHINPESEVDSIIGFYSFRTDSILFHRAVFSRRFQYSLVHSRILDELDMQPMDLPGGLVRRIITHLGIIRSRRYVRLVAHQPRLQIQQQPGDFLVFSDPLLPQDPRIYLGQNFLDRYLGGRLPRL
ncbi:hypothetical protein B0T16DRAFT_419447 [Cercophora newfieldiana]|uniref:Uncharacterized protein n=1 Tax=Cercophora newfieldiana TaxID=92897 RepID=A0AA39XVV5_9PEZI|nr:hypothetical protein B0T16DRAFT_419447 [Cercophora newfieldiana]